MSANAAVIELLNEILEPAGHFKARAMFGGYGLYLDGTFFAILDDGVLYFKVCSDTQARYAAEGMSAFTYRTKTGTQALLSYWRVPERLYDDPDDLAAWVKDAVKAARAHRAGLSTPVRRQRVVQSCTARRQIARRSAPGALRRGKR